MKGTIEEILPLTIVFVRGERERKKVVKQTFWNFESP
jgi:hypothetical protein